MNNRILIFALFLLISFISRVMAYTICLRNGRSLEGLIEKEDDKSVELNIGIGIVKFRREEIKEIYRSIPSEDAIRRTWETQKERTEEIRLRRQQEFEEAKRKKELKPKEVNFSPRDNGQAMVVNALLNKKVNASLVLDTGASCVVLSDRIAKKLGIETTKRKNKDIIKVQVADGRKVDAMYIVLDSINVEGVEVRGVETIVFLDSYADIEDGVLGMSFLNNFIFQVNTIDKKIILKKREE